MVLLRGLFGARLSYLPTVLNILQCVGWGDLRAGHDRDRGTHGRARPAQAGVRPDRRGGHRPADHPAAGRGPGAAPVCDQRRAHRAVLSVHPAHQAPAARLHARHLVGLLGRHRHRGRRRDLVRAAGRRLHPALPQPARRLRGHAGRLQHHAGAVLRHRPARAGHRARATRRTSTGRSSRCRSARSPSPSWPRGNSTSRSRTCTPRRSRCRTCARCGTGGSWPA